MKFLADVNITQSVISFLRNAGHDVTDIKKIDPQLTDKAIIKIAQKENRIILSHDKDFLTWVKYPKYQIGTILIRLKEQNSPHFCQKLQELLNDRTEQELHNSLTIIEEESTNLYPFKLP